MLIIHQTNLDIKDQIQVRGENNWTKKHTHAFFDFKDCGEEYTSLSHLLLASLTSHSPQHAQAHVKRHKKLFDTAHSSISRF